LPPLPTLNTVAQPISLHTGISGILSSFRSPPFAKICGRTKRPRLLEHPHVANMEWVEAAGNGYHHFFGMPLRARRPFLSSPYQFTEAVFSAILYELSIISMSQKIKDFLFKNTTTKQTVAKNTVWLSISQFGARIFKAFIIIYAARVLGAAGYGIFSYVVTLAGFFGIFVDLGINSVLIRDGSKASPEERQSLFSTTLIMKAIAIAAQ